jgi:23S rRNA-/tRNA-specific pseudouridylate synthase
MDSIKAPREAVKYFVVNHENDWGLAIARPANMTVQRGNRVVSTSVVFKYKFHKDDPELFSVE